MSQPKIEVEDRII